MKRNATRDKRNISRETKECGREYNENRCPKQNKGVGEGLELVRGTKESQSEYKVLLRPKTKRSRLRRPELVRGTKKKSIGRQRAPPGIQRNPVVLKGLGLVIWRLKNVSGKKKNDTTKNNLGSKQKEDCLENEKTPTEKHPG